MGIDVNWAPPFNSPWSVRRPTQAPSGFWIASNFEPANGGIVMQLGTQYSLEPPRDAAIFTVASRSIPSFYSGLATVRVGIEAGPITRRAYGAQADAAVVLDIVGVGGGHSSIVSLVSGLRTELVQTFPIACGSRPAVVITAIAALSGVRDGYVELIARIAYVRFTLPQPYPCY